MNLKNKRGITLIALVITIIVLLILAAVSIATLTGENGILTRATDSKEQTEIASVKEQAQLDIANWIAERLKNNEDTTLDDTIIKNIIETANASNTDKYYKELQSDKIITPSGYEVLYSELYANGGIQTETTIGQIYSDGMIGQKMTYASNGLSDWIVFGKDKDENILLLSEKIVIPGDLIYGKAEVWLNYEKNLHQKCSIYGNTIQGKNIMARDITLEDINYVLGFNTSDLSFDTYTFGKEQNYENKKVNYYFPSLEATESNLWKKATEENDEEKIKNDWYYYRIEEDKILYTYSGGKDIEATNKVKNKDFKKYIFGENGTLNYLVASRSVNVGADRAIFNIASVR